MVLKTLNQGISLRKESIHLEKNRFIFYAVRDILAKTCEKQFHKTCACSYHMVRG